LLSVNQKDSGKKDQVVLFALDQVVLFAFSKSKESGFRPEKACARCALRVCAAWHNVN